MIRIQVPVLIVGAGPVGLMRALLLARHATAAHVVNARTFEICRAAEVDLEALTEFASEPEDAGHAISGCCNCNGSSGECLRTQ